MRELLDSTRLEESKVETPLPDTIRKNNAANFTINRLFILTTQKRK